MSEEMEPNDLSRILDSYLSEMAEIADHYGATVDKFIGDGIMIFFGDPKSKGTKKDAEICVAMALDMQRRMNLLQIKWRQEGIDRNLQVRMGINTGFCTVGNFGSNDRMNYTAVGTEVNLASRLETACEPGEVLISSSTYLLVQDKFVCKSCGDVQVKGFAEAVPAFKAVGSRSELGNVKDYLSYSSEGFSINIDTEAIPTYDRKKVIEALQSANELVQRNFRKQ
jgi:class 3 adenylate cyclase